MSNDPNSKNGLCTQTWGGALWHTLHMISFNYPPEPTKADKRNYARFLLSLRHVLPCRYCRDNYPDNLLKAGLLRNKHVFDSRETFSRFIYDLHNEVSRNLKKKPFDKSFEEVQRIYNMCRARGCAKTTPKDGEKGCTRAMHTVPLKYVGKLVPRKDKCPSFDVDPKCYDKDVD